MGIKIDDRQFSAVLDTEFRLRRAVADDSAAITAIYSDEVLYGLASFEYDPPDQAEMAARMALLQQRGFPYWVAVATEGEYVGQVAGYGYASPYRPRKAYRFAAENSIYVATWARGRGVASLLIDRLIEDCRQCGFAQIIAVISSGEGIGMASIALHEKMGFTHAGLIKKAGWKQGQWINTTLMQLFLQPDDFTPDQEPLISD